MQSAPFILPDDRNRALVDNVHPDNWTNPAPAIHPYSRTEAIEKLTDAHNRTRFTPFVKKILSAWLKWQRKTQ